MKGNWRIWLGCFLTLTLFGGLSGCKATRFVGPDELLLQTDPAIRHDRQLVDPEELELAVRMQANRRMLWPKMALYTHNFARQLENLLRPKKEPVLPEGEIKGLGNRVLRLLKYRWGEPPIVVDTSLIRQDQQNLRNFYFAHGYFYPKITNKIDTLHRFLRPKKSSRKAKVSFQIEEGYPYQVQQVILSVPDVDSVSGAFLKSLYDYRGRSITIRPGDRYDHERFEQERQRGAKSIRYGGFAYFSPSDVRFVIDTLPYRDSITPTGAKLIDLKIQLRGEHQPYQIRQTLIRVHEPPRPDAGTSPDKITLPAGRWSAELRDSLGINKRQRADSLGIAFEVDPGVIHRVNYNFLAQRIRLGDPKGGGAWIDYRQQRINQTQQGLQELSMVQYLLINFREIRPGVPKLQAEIDLFLTPRFRVKAGAEAFTRDITAQNATFLPSIGGNLGLRNRNAFGKSERFELTLSGSVGLLNRTSQVVDTSSLGGQAQPYYQVGASAELFYPRFLFTRVLKSILPEKMTRDFDLYKPTTTLAARATYEQIGDEFQQLAPGAQLTYKWRNHRGPFVSKKWKTVQSTEFSPISITFISPSLNVGLDDFATTEPGSLINLGSQSFDALSLEVLSLPPLLYQDFLPRLNSRLQISFNHHNYRQTRAFPTYWYRASVEVGGNVAALLEEISVPQGWDSLATDNRLFNQFFYGRYVRGALEGKLFIPLTKTSELVLRGSIGAGVPIGDSDILPREARFFSGGLNGMRGWPSNTLGPGQVRSSGDLGGQDLVLNGDTILAANNLLSSLSAPGGEYLFELNAEYRFDFIPALYLELALFTDLGNVWLSRGAVRALAPGQALPQSKASLNQETLSLGWDVGVGFRFDVSFLVIRIDLGQQLYSPALRDWVIKREGLRRRRLLGETLRLNPSLAIGYPF